MSNIIAWGMPSMGEWIVVAVLGLLFFGKRLPEVGRSLGKGIVEFKKGLKGIEDEIDLSVEEPSQPTVQSQPRRTLPDQKFDPYTGMPVQNPEYKFDPYTGKPLTTQGAAAPGEESATVPPESH